MVRTKIVLVLFFALFMVLPPAQAALAKNNSSKLIGKKTKVSFDKSLPEDISNENFPDIIESFDYPDANILDLVKAIGKLTGLNFIVDPALSSKQITVIAPSKITVAEAYKAFLSALAINGYALVKSGAFWKVQETKNALKDNTEIYSGDYFPNTDQLITRIIKLKHIDGKEFSDSIKYLLSQNNQISYHPSSNSVIISDYGSVIERIMKIVYQMDVPGSREMVKVIVIEHASATELADMLSELLSISKSAVPRGSSRSRARSLIPKKQSTGNIKISSIIPNERTNSIVVSANDEGLKRIQDLILKLDIYVDPSRRGGIYVYNVLHGTAEEVYNTLMGIKPSRTRSSNSSNFPRSRTLSSGRYSSSSSLSSSKSPLFENVTIMADANTNSLIISAKNKYDFERVKQVLSKIDVPRDQVFVQAIIVEMSVDKGNNWEVNLAKSLQTGTSSLLKFLNIDDTSIIGGFLNRGFSADPSTILQNSSLGPGLVLGLPLKKIFDGLVGGGASQSKNLLETLTDPRIDSLNESERSQVIRGLTNNSNAQSISQALNYSVLPLLQVLKRAGNVNVLSTPQITTLDNVEASIEVGENAPVGITSAGSGFGSVVQNTVDRQDVTMKLQITPRINPKSGTVQMDIKQKFDDFSQKISTASELRDKGVHITKRNIETKMVLNDGETAVLGGLLTDKEVRNESKVPVLGDIPILGWLFKGSDVIKEKRNLIVFITPRIIRGENQKKEMRRLLEQKLEERVEFIKKYMKGKDPHGDMMDKIQTHSSLRSDTSSLNKNESIWNDVDQEEINSNNLKSIPEDRLPTVPLDVTPNLFKDSQDKTNLDSGYNKQDSNNEEIRLYPISDTPAVEIRQDNDEENNEESNEEINEQDQEEKEFFNKKDKQNEDGLIFEEIDFKDLDESSQ